MRERPFVGVGVIIMNPDGDVLLGKRKGSHGAGTWSLPGGHLEYGESFQECCERETEEETGISIGQVSRFEFTNDMFPEVRKHYVTLFFKIFLDDYAEPELREPDKCEEWGWFNEDELPSPLFLPLETLLTMVAEER